MSDSDFSDELLELAGATDKPSGHGGTTAEKKRKRRQQSSSSKPKRRKPDVESDSDDNGPESEEEDESGNVNPYPLEGKYVDEADRARLNQMSEVEREGIISQRLEEMQRIQDKRNLDQMLKAQKSGGGGGGGGDGGGGVSKSAKRAHPVRGATKEKTRKLDELRAKRKAKDERKRTKGSPKNGRDRSSSPMDMETSDEEEEEGMISKQDEEEERERRLLAKYTGTGANKGDVDDEEGNAVATIEDLEKVRLSRDLLAKHYLAPWFEDYVKGAWVRYLIGQDKEGRPTYRICEIQNLAADLVKPYKINDQTVNQHFELKHGGSVKDFPMDKTSNAKFDPREYDRIVRVYEAEKLKLPTKRQITKKVELMAKLVAQPMTESDITAMLARKSLLQSGSSKHSGSSLTMERSRLTQARTLALRRQDYKELAALDAQLAELALQQTISSDVPQSDERSDILAKVNERNRKSNLESIRKAEIAESERKRRERKLAAAAGSGTATPIPVDPSARLKIMPTLFRPASRPGTPAMNGTPKAATPQGTPPTLPPSALSNQTPTKNTVTSVLDNVEIDLGDF